MDQDLDESQGTAAEGRSEQVASDPVTGGFGTFTGGSVVCGESLTVLGSLPDEVFACCITSPPYWDPRYAGKLERLGCERDIRDYLRTLVGTFSEVRRTLRPGGTLWLVIGDSYAGRVGSRQEALAGASTLTPDGFKQSELIGIPWRLALALQEDGWYLQADIVWSFPGNRENWVGKGPRLVRAHDYVFLLSPTECCTIDDRGLPRGTVWEIPAVRDSPIEYTVLPEVLVERCMHAGSSPGDIVLDPFFGSGTVGIVAHRLRRRFLGIEIDPESVALAEKRIQLAALSRNVREGDR